MAVAATVPPAGPRAHRVGIVIAEDDAPMRSALAALLSAEPGLEILGVAADAAQAIDLATRHHPDVCVADVMDREPVTIPGDLSVEQALDEYFLRYRWPWFPVVDAAHRFLGLVMRDRADEVPEISRSSSHVSDLVDHDIGLFVRDDTPLDSLLANQNLRRLGALMAVDAEGRLSGVVTIEQVGRALRDSTAR